MDIAFAGPTALEVIRRVRLSQGLSLVPVEKLDYSGFAMPRGALKRISFPALGLSAAPTKGRPATIRAPKASQRKRVEGVRSILFPKYLPARAFLQLKSSDGENKDGEPQLNELFAGMRVYVDSVPLACLSIAASYQRLIRKGKLDEGDAVVRLVELLMEFAGHYGRDPADPRSGSVTCDLSPLISIEEVRTFLRSCRHVKGSSLLGKALAYARDGSRSPMETCLFMVLTMPRDYGLVGLCGAKLNTALVPTAAQRALMRHKTLTPDILWESAGTAVEYQGEESHTGKAARAEDNRRLNDYQVCGVRAHFVTFDDVRTAAGLDKLALEIAESMRLHGACTPGDVERLRAFLAENAPGTLRARHLAHLLPPVRG